MLFRFWVTRVQSEEEEGEGEDEQNSLLYIAPYIYDARYHANPYNYTKIILPYLVIYIWMTKVLSGGIMRYKQTSWGGVLTAKFIGIDVHAIYTSLN